ncbi:MAG: DUF1127 domain-containing protein [Pseudomonadota bacterium]
MLSYFKPIAKAWFKQLRNRSDLRELLEKDDRILRDVGLTRADVESALAKPMEFDARTEALRLSRISLQLDRATF